MNIIEINSYRFDVIQPKKHEFNSFAFKESLFIFCSFDAKHQLSIFTIDAFRQHPKLSINTITFTTLKL